MSVIAVRCFNFLSNNYNVVTHEERETMTIKYVNGHYEIVSADSGQFIQSADTWDEAVSDMEELLKTSV